MTVLLNSLWVGMVLAVAMWAALKAMPWMNAATRHALWWVALGAVMVLPVAGVVVERSAFVSGAPAVSGAAERVRAGTPVAGGDAVGETAAVVSERQAVRVPVEAAHSQWEPIRVAWWAAAWAVGGMWIVLSVVLGVRLARGYLWMGRVKAGAVEAPATFQARLRELQRRTGVRRGARLMVSAEVTAPVVLGLARPAIVIPESLVESLSGEDFDHVALHELAHLARFDDWTNLVQRVAEVVFPIQPAVIWIGRQIGLDREAACDDWVVGVTGEGRSYAAALTRVAELTMWSRSGVLASGTIGRPSQLYRRVARLVGGRRARRVGVSYAATGVGIGALAVMIFFAIRAPRVIAVTDAPASAGAAAGTESGAAVGLGAAVGGRWISPLEFEQSQTFSVAATDRLAVDVDRGDVHVTAWDKNEVAIVVRYTAKHAGDLEQILDHHKTTMTQPARAVDLDAKGDAWLSTTKIRFDITYEIQVPAKMETQVRDALGDVVVSSLAGSVDAGTSMGDVNANDCSGALKAGAKMGDVTVKNFAGPTVDAQVQSGDVRVEMTAAPKGDCALRVSMGDVEVKLPASAAVKVAASTRMGDVKSDFSGGAGPVVTATTNMGDVRVEKE